MSSAIETQAMDNIREAHMRHIVMRFLDETKVFRLERDLTELLLNIDRSHQEEIRMLNLRITELIQNTTTKTGK